MLKNQQWPTPGQKNIGDTTSKAKLHQVVGQEASEYLGEFYQELNVKKKYFFVIFENSRARTRA